MTWDVDKASKLREERNELERKVRGYFSERSKPNRFESDGLYDMAFIAYHVLHGENHTITLDLNTKSILKNHAGIFPNGDTYIDTIIKLSEAKILDWQELRNVADRLRLSIKDDPFYTNKGLTEEGKDVVKYLLRDTKITKKRWEKEVKTVMLCIGLPIPRAEDTYRERYNAVQRDIKAMYLQ